jgi:hypothetical protein
MAEMNCGVIEGFYGRPWSWEDRTNYATFLAEAGFNFYLYAPKADSWLRRDWQEPWPASHEEKLRELREAYRVSGIRWGLGLSPFDLHRDYGSSGKQLLSDKISRINMLEPDILCILFDDMRADKAEVAKTQAEIMQDVCNWSGADTVIVCPSYYSLDPVLDELFGQRPENYLQTLGEQLPTAVEIFWTGNKVVPDTISRADLRQVAELSGRTPWLWDNYPVNDGERASKHLHLDAFSGRDPGLGRVLGGHAVNPMNQAWLSKIPLLTLLDVYRKGDDYDKAASLVDSLERVCGAELGRQMQADLPLFQEQGLDHISDTLKQKLLERYSKFSSPCAREVVDWLRGEYRFDPECLTG